MFTVTTELRSYNVSYRFLSALAVENISSIGKSKASVYTCAARKVWTIQ